MTHLFRKVVHPKSRQPSFNGDSRRSADCNSVSLLNPIFSPFHESETQNDYLGFQQLQSPCLSLNLPQSPSPSNDNKEPGSLDTPLFLDSFNRMLSNEKRNEDMLNMQQVFALPLKLGVPLSNSVNQNKDKKDTKTPSFEPFVKDQKSNLLQFLQEQKELVERKGKYSVNKNNHKNWEGDGNSMSNVKMRERLDRCQSPSSEEQQQTFNFELDKCPVFNGFKELLVDYFVNGNISEERFTVLTPFQRTLLFLVVKRKNEPKAITSKPSLLFSFEELQRLIKVKNRKRPEECYKFVLTRVIKHLKQEIDAKYKRKAQIENCLYDYFFKATAEALGVPLSDFHYPLTGMQKGKFKLNSVYFSKIFASDVFVKAVHEYCENRISQDYQREIEKKISFLVCKWSEMVSASPQNIADAQLSIVHYVTANKRCKLPWSIEEVRDSVSKFLNLIKLYQHKAIRNQS